MLALVAYFDRDRSGKISVDEFQVGLAPPLPEGRLALIQEAFRRLDKSGDGTVTIDDLAAAYDTSLHPKVHLLACLSTSSARVRVFASHTSARLQPITLHLLSRIAAGEVW